MYFKNGNITTRPKIEGVINPSHATIINNGWFVYVDNVPHYNPETHRIEKTSVIEGVQQYEVIELTPQEIWEMTVPTNITKFQGQEMLDRIGKFDMVLGHINAMKASEDTETSTQGRMFYYAFNSIPEWQRSSQTIIYMATQLGLTSEELDTFFIEAKKIELP